MRGKHKLKAILIFFSIQSAKLNNEDKMLCEGLITVAECTTALNEMNLNKSPGSDGITVEFYKQFWDILKEHFVKSINYSFNNQSLTELQKQGLISLIPKPGKDLEQLSNWRPISLLNIDYKIATKSIANRMKKIISKIISQSQSGFIKGRYIGENIRLIQEVIDHLNMSNTDGLLLFVDFEKAFDSIDHTFIIKCLEHFNFGQDLIHWVRLFYTDIKGIISNNGYLSDSFLIQRGVRQGCPLSSFLFLICIETLSNYIDHCQEIEGIMIENNHIKQTLFADDATFFNNGKESSFNTLINVIEEFGKSSGLKINYSKTIVLQVGRLKDKHLQISKNSRFTWTSTTAKTLGIIFSNDYTSFVTNNIIPKVQDFKKCLKQWQHRKLTLMGKVAVIKTFALPKLVFPFTVLPNPPDQLLDDISNSMFAFIWDNKPDKIKREQLYNSRETGGLNLPNIKIFLNSIKASWVKRYIDENNKGKWKIFFDKVLVKRGAKIIFDCNITENDLKTLCGQNPFMQNVLIAWNKLQNNNIQKDIRKNIIWNNSEIKLNNKTLYYKDWHERGVLYLEHIFDFRTNAFYSFENIQFLYQIPTADFLKYIQLLKSIPKNIKDKLASIDIRSQAHSNSLLDNVINSSKNKTTNSLYKLYMNNRTSNFKHKEKWETILGYPLNWKKIYTMPFVATIDTCIQAFQYKIINRIIPTNKYLFKCKLTNSSLCDLCSSNVESIVHLFWECPIIQDLWNSLKLYLQTYNIQVEFNLHNVMFGLEKLHKYNIANFMILLMKYFIFCSKYRHMIPNFQNFKNYLSIRINIERTIAIAKNKLHVHLQKWSALTQE